MKNSEKFQVKVMSEKEQIRREQINKKAAICIPVCSLVAVSHYQVKGTEKYSSGMESLEGAARE